MRVSARLDERRGQKLDLIRKTTNQSTSEILKEALDLYFEQIRTGADAAQVFRDTGFIASGEADPDLSSRSKEEVRKILLERHADR